MILVFLFHRLTLCFSYTFVDIAKLKRSNFPNDFSLSLTAIAPVSHFPTHSSKNFLGHLRDWILIIRDLPHSTK